jgi:DNA polymerase III sliding clamp (beta) subunit (PCNA family)
MGLAANPNEDNAININQQDQSEAAKRVWVLTHRSKRSSRIASIGLKHLKVKATSPQVKVSRVKVESGEAMKDQ